MVVLPSLPFHRILIYKYIHLCFSLSVHYVFIIVSLFGISIECIIIMKPTVKSWNPHRIEPQNFTVWYHSPVSKLFSCTNLSKNTVLDPLHSFINEMTFQAPPNQFAQPIQPKLLLMYWYALIFLAAFLKITDLFIVLMPQINVLILCFYFL